MKIDLDVLARIYIKLIAEQVSYRVVREWNSEEQETLFNEYFEIAKTAAKVYSENIKGE
jgi:hypothetical protein